MVTMRGRSFWMVLLSFWMLGLHALLGAAAPVITSITPYHVEPELIGTPVTITGSGFTGATAVFFGGTPATSFQVLSDTSMTATIPAHSPGTVFVNVTTPSGTSPNTPAAYFVYQGDWEAYVLNTAGLPGEVSVIDTATQMVIATIAVGNAALPGGVFAERGIAITPNGMQAYVTNFSDNSVSVIDTATPQMVIATITLPVGSNPIGVAITPDGMQAYVTNSISSTVSVIDTATPQMVIATITLPVGSNPIGVAITPDGMQAYVTNSISSTVSVIDTATPQMVIATITLPVGLNPIGVAITPDGMQAYVTNSISSTVSVIDTATPQMVIATITLPVGSNPIGVAITPDGMQAYVTNSISSTVSVIDTATPQMVIATITLPVGSNPVGVAITPDGMQAYVANFGISSVSIIDTETRTVSAIVTVGFDPESIAITPDQAPLARFTVTTAPAGSPSTFDASGSVSPVGTIVNYSWNFGDGTTLETPDPVVSHTYAVPGNYTVTLVVTNSAGTSTLEIYTPPSIIINGGPSALSMQTITIIPAAPVVQNIHPSSGPTCGGTVVTITGTNFTGATAVFFGSVPAEQFTIQSDTTIIATSPPGSPGTVDITVVTPFGTSAVISADRFTYLSPFPPKDLRGRQVKNRFATQTDIINILTWKAPCRFSHTCAPVAYRIYRNSSLTQFVAEVRIPTNNSLFSNAPHGHFRFKDHHRKEGKTYPYFVVSVDRFGNISSPAKVVIKGR